MRAKKVAGVLVSAFLATSIALPSFASEVERREIRQQQRIRQGVRSGELTARETLRLESEQARLDREEARMRSRNDGPLNAKQKLKINRQENRMSRQIEREKHD